MHENDLIQLITDANEDLGVEYKAWMDTAAPAARAKLARHIAALANHGGGYLVFGIDDETRKPQGQTALERAMFGQEAMASIIRKYLDPRVQVTVQSAEFEGVRYPVIVVQSHGARPVIAIADGPADANGKPAGLVAGTIYIRAPGPQSVAIRTGDDWNALLDRCLSHRTDLLGVLFRQSIARQARPSRRIAEMLVAAVNETAADFQVQTAALAAKVKPEQRPEIELAGDSFSAMGYALVGGEGELAQIPDLRRAIDQASIAMRRYAHYGWSSFLPLTVIERAPAVRMGSLADEEASFLEGMRVDNTALLSSAYDYWRLYDFGIGVSVESFRDNWTRQGVDPVPRLTPAWILASIHSLLAHARLVGQEIPGIAQVVVRIDWRGLLGRVLMWDDIHVASPQRLASDRFAKTIDLSWAELRDDYFTALRRVAMPVFGLFSNRGYFDPEELLTPEIVRREFERVQRGTMMLFDE